MAMNKMTGKEADLLFGTGRTFGIYQIRSGSAGDTYAFMNMNFIESHGIQVRKEDYALIYTAELEENMSLEDIFERFYINKPADFYGHSLSVSDVIVLNDKGHVAAYFVDSISFQKIDFFLDLEEKKEPYLEYYAAECDEFHNMGAYEKSTDVKAIAAIYEKYRENPENVYKGCGMGIIYRNPEDSLFDEAELQIVSGTTIHGDVLDDDKFLREQSVVREGIEKIHEALPDYKYIPSRDVRETLYPERMTTEELAAELDKIAEDFEPYEYRNHVESGQNTVQEVMLDLQSGNIGYYISYLKDMVEEECEQSVRAGVLLERLKGYEPDLPSNLEPMVYVNYCEKAELMNPRCQKLADLDSLVARQDKTWYEDRNLKTDETMITAKLYVTVYYAEKNDKMLHQFKGKIDIGTGNGGILSQLKLQNEMKLTDESWIGYLKGKGNEEFQKYMENLTDMQNHVLPYLQSFCRTEEQQVVEKRDSAENITRVTNDISVGGIAPDGIAALAAEKEEKKVLIKKPSIHERLENNKKKIQEQQGKDESGRGADLGVR